MKLNARLAVVLCSGGFLQMSFAVPSAAQTLSLNDRSVVLGNPERIGLNLGTINYYDSGQLLKNLIGSNNPGMEPLLNQQIWVLDRKGTTTTFSVPDQWDAVPANYWAGGTVSVVESESGGAERRCSSTIASNTGPNYPNETNNTDPIITISSPCATSFDVGDIVIISKSTFPTPESWWESGSRGGTWGSVEGGGKLVSDTTDLCATCGRQALDMDASPGGSSATATWYFDSGSDNAYVLLNGTYRVTFWAKLATGSPVLTVTANRLSAGGFNCGRFTPRLTSAWALYKWDCNTSENAATIQPGNAQVRFSVQGGSIDLDNVSFAKANTSPSNPTIFRDEVIQTLQKFFGPPSSAKPPTLRYWLNQNAETMNNWTQRDYAHEPVASGTGYFIQPTGGGAVSLSLHDYLVICQLLKADPYLEVPVTFSTADAANLIEFLGGVTSSPYGARRAALGPTEPWTRIFSTIHLSFCNECWNFGSFPGQSLSSRRSAPNQEYYYDYSTRARDIFAAMRAAPGYNSSSFDLGMNAQTAVTWTMDAAIARAHPDSIEIEGYTYGPVKSFSTDAALWQPAIVDPYMKVMSPSDAFYKSVHDYQAQKTCGPTGNVRCKVKIYEWGQGTLGGGIDQKHLDFINEGAGEAAVMALQSLLIMQQYGIGPQAFFSLAEYRQTGNPAPKLWGNVVDMGGATNSVRPTFLGPQLVNQSMIGPMFSCSIKNSPTYKFAGSPNGEPPMPAIENVPYLYAFCFKNGDTRSIILINTDLTNSHAISFEGTDPPQRSITERQLAPRSLDDLNEAPSGSPTVRAASLTSIKTSLLPSLDKIDLPPASVTAFDYTIRNQHQ